MTPRASASSRKPTSIDAYLATVRDERRRAALERLRARIHAAAPGAEECISYGMPAFRLGGHVIAGFLATSGGCSYYPFSGSTLAALGDALDGFSKTRSALHFDPSRPPSAALVRRLVGARRAELPAPRGPRPSGPGPRPPPPARRRPTTSTAPARARGGGRRSARRR